MSDQIGATGEPPTSDAPGDLGGLKAALRIRGDRLRLEFGKELRWVEMTKSEAMIFAKQLIIFANKLP
jgi:hypothetical protein